MVHWEHAGYGRHVTMLLVLNCTGIFDILHSVQHNCFSPHVSPCKCNNHNLSMDCLIKHQTLQVIGYYGYDDIPMPSVAPWKSAII